MLHIFENKNIFYNLLIPPNRIKIELDIIINISHHTISLNHYLLAYFF